MNYVTVGRECPEWQVMVTCLSHETFSSETEYEPRFRLVLVEEGTGIMTWGNKRQVFIAPALFCFSETEHPRLEKSQRLRARSIYFHPNVIYTDYTFENVRDGVGLPVSALQDLTWLMPFIRRDGSEIEAFSLGPTTAQRVAGFIEMIDYLLSEQSGAWPCRSRSYLLELLFLVERLTSSAQSISCQIKPSNGMDEIVLYLHQNYASQVTLAELARVFHINRTSLVQRFHETTGVTIRSYLINLRIRVASMLLRDTMLPIVEVAERVGFKDITHFGRTFKQVMNMTPSDYRRENCWMLRWYPDYRD